MLTSKLACSDVENVCNPDTICGVDWSGNVVKKGKSVTTFEIGDHVAGFTHGGNYKDRGAFAEYLKVPADLTWKVPEGTFSHEEAATTGCGYVLAISLLAYQLIKALRQVVDRRSGVVPSLPPWTR